MAKAVSVIFAVLVMSFLLWCWFLVARPGSAGVFYTYEQTYDIKETSRSIDDLVTSRD